MKRTGEPKILASFCCWNCKQDISIAADETDLLISDDHKSTDRQSIEIESGDVTICCYCAAIQIFEQDLTTRELTESEWEMVPRDISAQIRERQTVIRDERAN